jgi:hypothetical protein
MRVPSLRNSQEGHVKTELDAGDERRKRMVKTESQNK